MSAFIWIRRIRSFGLLLPLGMLVRHAIVDKKMLWDLAVAPCWKTSASLRIINLFYHRLYVHNRSSIDRFDWPNQQPVLDDSAHSHQM